MKIPMKPAGIITVPNYKDCSVEVKPNGQLVLMFTRASNVDASNFVRFEDDEEVGFVHPPKCLCDHPVLCCSIHEDHKKICPHHHGKQKCFCPGMNSQRVNSMGRWFPADSVNPPEMKFSYT
jgi:hypothetical protein